MTTTTPGPFTLRTSRANPDDRHQASRQLCAGGQPIALISTAVRTDDAGPSQVIADAEAIFAAYVAHDGLVARVRELEAALAQARRSA